MHFMRPEDSLPHSQVPATYTILSQLVAVRAPTSHFLKIYLNIILTSTTGFPQWSLSFRFPHQNPVQASPHTYPLDAERPFKGSRSEVFKFRLKPERPFKGRQYVSNLKGFCSPLYRHKLCSSVP